MGKLPFLPAMLKHLKDIKSKVQQNILQMALLSIHLKKSLKTCSKVPALPKVFSSLRRKQSLSQHLARIIKKFSNTAFTDSLFHKKTKNQQLYSCWFFVFYSVYYIVTLLVFVQIPIFSASLMSSSRKSG